MMSSILDGLNTCHEMQEDPDLKDIPLIMVSSIISSPHASLFPTDEYIPIDTWISKPMDPDDLLEKVRTRKRAWAWVIALTEQALAGRRAERVAILHVNAQEDARLFEQQLRASLPCPDTVIMAELTPGLSVHSGAGLVGVTVVAAPDTRGRKEIER